MMVLQLILCAPPDLKVPVLSFRVDVTGPFQFEHESYRLDYPRTFKVVVGPEWSSLLSLDGKILLIWRKVSRRAFYRFGVASDTHTVPSTFVELANAPSSRDCLLDSLSGFLLARERTPKLRLTTWEQAIGAKPFETVFQSDAVSVPVRISCKLGNPKQFPLGVSRVSLTRADDIGGLVVDLRFSVARAQKCVMPTLPTGNKLLSKGSYGEALGRMPTVAREAPHK